MAGKGQLKGFVGNPSGKNQHVDKAGTGERTKRFSVRVTLDMDEAIRASVEAEGISLTQWVEDAFARKLKGVVGEKSDIEQRSDRSGSGAEKGSSCQRTEVQAAG